MNSDTLALIIYYLAIAVFLLLMPYVVFPTLPFGVRIPLAYAQDPAVLTERKRYTLRLSLLEGGLLLAGIALWVLTGWQALERLSILILVSGAWGIYYLSHRSLEQVKTEQQWYKNRRQAIVASIEPRSTFPSAGILPFAALPFILLIMTAAIGVWRYPALPTSLHFIFPQNMGEWVLSTTPINAFLPVIFQVIATLIFAGLAFMRQMGSQPVDVEDPEGSLRFQQITTQTIQALLLLLALGFNTSFMVTGLVGWGLLQAGGTLSQLIILAPLGWLIVAPFLLMGLQPEPKMPEKRSSYTNRDDDSYWKLGVIYINRNDPSLLVNKRFGIGRTLNFGNPVAWVIALALAAFIVYKIMTRLPG